MSDLIERMRAMVGSDMVPMEKVMHLLTEAADVLEAAQAERKVVVAEALKYADKSGRLEAKVEQLARALREMVALGHPRDPAIIAAKNALRGYEQEVSNG